MKILLKRGWLQEYSYDESIKILKGLARPHVEQSGPFAEDLRNFLDRCDWSGLLDYELDYGRAASVLHFKHARQVLAFFQKFEPLEFGIDKEAVAHQKFEKSEKACQLTNRLLRAQRRGEFYFYPVVNDVLYIATQKIARVLRDVPSLVDLPMGFGPGATTTTKSKDLNWASKLRSPIECSTNFASTIPLLASQAPHWFLLHADNRDKLERYAYPDCSITYSLGSGHLHFVPKTAKTYRTIMVEPILNGFYQRGVGRVIRQRLKRYGVDLDDQSRNQALAKSGSIGDSLATVDLSSASDTISRELVYELLPLDWARFLETGRTSSYQYKGVSNPVPLEKFSSMGNGYTFELESLIFWALSHAVLTKLGLPLGWLSVYGDDIVLPKEAVPLLRQVFLACGFTVNEDKTFSSGPFRESCGKDYYQGIDIRPFYQKSFLSCETLFSLHNFYMRDLDFGRARAVRRLIPDSLAIYGPDGYGDGHLIGDWSPRLPKRDAAQGWEGGYFRCFQRRPTRLKRLRDCDLALCTYSTYIGASSDAEYDPLVVRGSSGYRVASIYTLRRGIFLR